MLKKIINTIKRQIDIRSLQALITINGGIWEFSNGKFYSPCGFYIPNLVNNQPKLYPNGKWYADGSIMDKWHKKYSYLTDISVYYRNKFTPAEVCKY